MNHALGKLAAALLLAARIPAASHRPGTAEANAGSGARLFALVLALVSAACSDAPSDEPGTAASSTAAAAVDRDAGEAARTFSADPAPLYVIGDSIGEELFRPAGVALLPGCELAIASGGDNQVSVYDARGGLQARFGRPGKGPGEFTGLAALALAGDTIITYDRALRRLSWLHSASGYLRSRRLVLPAMGQGRFLGLLGGRAVFRASFVTGRTRQAPAMPRPGPHRDTLRVVAVQGAGPAYTVIAQTPGRERVLLEDRSGEGTAPDFYQFGFERSGVAQAAGDVLVYGSTDRAELRIRRGREEIRTSWTHEDPGLGPAYLEVLRKIGGEPPGTPLGAAASAALARTRLPPTPPAFDRLVLGADRRIWVRSWAWPDAVKREWRAFDYHGRQLGTATLPATWEVAAICPGRVAVLHRDQDDVPTVRVHALTSHR